MNPPKMFLAALVLIPLGLSLFVIVPLAEGDAKADKALEDARARGKVLYKQSWKKGAKACFACHVRGPNKLTGRRLKTYPKYDKALRKVVTAQEKINNMIKTKSGGAGLDLGHADLTALEAYVSTLK